MSSDPYRRVFTSGFSRVFFSWPSLIETFTSDPFQGWDGSSQVAARFPWEHDTRRKILLSYQTVTPDVFSDRLGRAARQPHFLSLSLFAQSTLDIGSHIFSLSASFHSVVLSRTFWSSKGTQLWPRLCDLFWLLHLHCHHHKAAAPVCLTLTQTHKSTDTVIIHTLVQRVYVYRSCSIKRSAAGSEFPLRWFVIVTGQQVFLAREKGLIMKQERQREITRRQVQRGRDEAMKPESKPKAAECCWLAAPV